MSGGGPRLAHVQGLRAIAVLLVVGFHADLSVVRGGFVGVDVFFVISGFVITGLLLRDRAASGRIDFGRFYLRRVRRLLPALALVLVTTAVLSTLIESPLTTQRTTGRVGVFAAVFLANLALYLTGTGYFAQPAGVIPLLHTWSLSVEEQFYLVFPAVLALVFLLRGRKRALTATIAVVSAASLGLYLLGAYGSLPGIADASSAAFYAPLTRIWEFGAGALLALAYPVRADRRLAVGGAVTGAVLLVVAAVALDGDTSAIGVGLLLPVVATVLLIAFGPTARVLAWAPLQWLGDRSYSWYLWHWPLIVFATDVWPHGTPVAVAAAIVSLVPAALSYEFLEQRLRRPRPDTHPRRAARTGLVIAAVCTIVPGVLLGGLWGAATHNWGNANIARLADQVLPLPPGARKVGCPALDVDRPAVCTVHGTETGPPIFLVGDSNAGQYANGLGRAGVALHRPLVVLWRPNCPFVDVTVERTGVDGDACVRYNADVLGLLKRQSAGTVVTASVNSFITASEVTLRDPSGTATTVAAKQAMWTSGLTRSLQALAATKLKTVLVGVIPHPGGENSVGMPNWDPQTCSLVTMLRSIADCGRTVTLAEESSRQQQAIAAEHAAADSAHVPLLDLRSAVCPDGSCAAYRDGDWIYRNGVHVTVGESIRLTDRLEAALQAAG